MALRLSIDANLTLSGAGTVALSPDGDNTIAGSTTSAVILTNAGNTISGAGNIVSLSLINRGTINATTSAPLTISTGNTVINSGTLKATSGGNLVIDDSVTNSKLIEAFGGGATVTIENGSVISNTTPSVLIVASGKGAQVDLVATTIFGGTAEATSGSTAIVSGGTIGAGATVAPLSGGTAIVSGTVANSGTLIASALGGLLEIDGSAVVNGGAATIGNGIVDMFAGGLADISFRSSGSGGLEIANTSADPAAFTGAVSGFGGANHTNHTQFIDLVSVTFSAGQMASSYVSSGTNTSGTLFVSSGGQLVAEIDFVGAYSAGNFHVTSGAGGTVKITDPGVVNGGSVELGPAQAFRQHGVDLPDMAFGAHTTLAYSENTAGGGTLTVTDGRHAATIALLGNYMAGTFVTAADGHGGTLVTEASQMAQQPLLTHPQA